MRRHDRPMTDMQIVAVEATFGPSRHRCRQEASDGLDSDRGYGRLLDWVNCREDEASRILQVALLKYMLRKALAEKQRLEQANLHYRRKSALRTVVVAVLRSAVRSLQQDRISLPGVDLHVQKERAARRVLIALLRYQLARAKSRNNLLRSIPENLHEQDRWKLLLEKEEIRREALLVEKLNVINELRTLQDEKRALEKMLEEERKKLTKAKEVQNRLKSDLEIITADKMEIHLDLEQTKHRIADLEDIVANLEAALLSVATDYQESAPTLKKENQDEQEMPQKDATRENEEDVTEENEEDVTEENEKDVTEENEKDVTEEDEGDTHGNNGDTTAESRETEDTLQENYANLRRLALYQRKEKLEKMLLVIQREYEEVKAECDRLDEQQSDPAPSPSSETNNEPVNDNDSPSTIESNFGASSHVSFFSARSLMQNTIGILLSLWYLIFPFRRFA